MKKTVLSVAALLLAMQGCRKDTALIQEPTPQAIGLSAKVYNPYSVENMRNAAQELLVNGKTTTQHFKESLQSSVKGSNQPASGLNLIESAAIAKASISATHYYLKFKPIDDKQPSLLKADSTLVLYPFPLTNEVSPYSGSYRDPSVPANQPTYQYAAVAVGKKLPNVPYEKLDDLFLPDESKVKNTVAMDYKGIGYSISARDLAKQSIKGTPTSKMAPQNIPVGGGATTNLIAIAPPKDEEGGGGGGGGPSDPFVRGDEWRPHGRITLYDEVKNQTIGVEGIKVRARRWFTTYIGIADADGYYAVDGWFEGPANYWLDFERYEFSVNDGTGGPREISGPHVREAWNVNLVDFNKFCGNIFRAAFHYYYKDIQGLRRPPLNGFWSTQVKLGAFNHPRPTDIYSTVAGEAAPIRRYFGFGEIIHIYTLPDYNSSLNIYSTTIHELGHTVHWQMPNTPPLQNLPNIMTESWSRGVEWALTRMVYPGYPGAFNSIPTDYTNVIIDLIDSD